MKKISALLFTLFFCFSPIFGENEDSSSLPTICVQEAAPLTCFISKSNDNSKIKTVFAHGYGDTYRQAYHYKDLIAGSLETFNFPDVEEQSLIYRKKTGMAQDNEIECLMTEIKRVQGKKDLTPILLFGVSRGASTIITTTSQMATDELANLRGLVLESPFATFDDVVDGIINQSQILKRIPLIRSVGVQLPEIFFGGYRRNGIRPINVIEQLPKDLPILFIASEEDQLVPALSTIKLYNKLRARGHKNIHLYLSPKGRHANILTDYGEPYRWVTHAFYKRYNIPHNEKFAEKGKSLLIDPKKNCTNF